jgi:hypothetical protein
MAAQPAPARLGLEWAPPRQRLPVRARGERQRGGTECDSHPGRPFTIAMTIHMRLEASSQRSESCFHSRRWQLLSRLATLVCWSCRHALHSLPIIPQRQGRYSQVLSSEAPELVGDEGPRFVGGCEHDAAADRNRLTPGRQALTFAFFRPCARREKSSRNRRCA